MIKMTFDDLVNDINGMLTRHDACDVSEYVLKEISSGSWVGVAIQLAKKTNTVGMITDHAKRRVTFFGVLPSDFDISKLDWSRDNG